MLNCCGSLDYQNNLNPTNGNALLSRNCYEPTKLEHIANMITHAIWIGPSLLGFFWMLQLSDNPTEILVISLYGVCLVSLFSVSTIFHYLSYTKQQSSSLRNFFHLGDRAVIYLFIAASYTPWLTLKDFHGHLSLTATLAVWSAAFAGILYQCTFHGRYQWLETIFYLLLGILPALVAFEIKDSSGLFDVAYGGVIYILGVVFFKADGILPCAHAVWHCFVTAGALVHYQAICHYLLH